MHDRPSYDSSVIGSEKYGLSYSIDEPRSPPPRPTDEDVTALPASIPYADIPPSAAPAQLQRPTRKPLWARWRTEYTLLSKKKKIAILVGVGALIVLIIGLAAGLSTRSHSSTSNLPLPSNHGGPYTGDLTYYDPGLGACGITSNSHENIVAVSHLIFDAVSTGSNPNANPLCGKKVRARRQGKSVDLTVVDRCVGCKATDLDTTDTVFRQLADIDQGRVLVEWAWLEDVPGGDIPSMTFSTTSATTSTNAITNTTATTTDVITTTTTVATSSTPVAPVSSTIPTTTTTLPAPVPTTTPATSTIATSQAIPPTSSLEQPSTTPDPPPPSSTIVETTTIPGTTSVAPEPTSVA